MITRQFLFNLLDKKEKIIKSLIKSNSVFFSKNCSLLDENEELRKENDRLLDELQKYKNKKEVYGPVKDVSNISIGEDPIGDEECNIFDEMGADDKAVENI